MNQIARRQPFTMADRLAALEKRADGHDKRADAHDTVIKPMAEQVAELFGAWTTLKTMNWFFVKLGAYIGGALGAIAVVLTIVNGALRLFTGH